MDESAIETLLLDLKDPDESIRDRATQELWRIWFGQKGLHGLTLLGHGQALMEAGNFAEADALLTEIIQNQPDFAEAWNRRAVLYYIQGDYPKALRDCDRAIALNPVHFGAIHGKGLCLVAMGDYRAAIRAFRQALDIQPHALMNQKMILECTAKLE